jgi:hypothetical protein
MRSFQMPTLYLSIDEFGQLTKSLQRNVLMDICSAFLKLYQKLMITLLVVAIIRRLHKKSNIFSSLSVGVFIFQFVFSTVDKTLHANPFICEDPWSSIVRMIGPGSKNPRFESRSYLITQHVYQSSSTGLSKAEWCVDCL